MCAEIARVPSQRRTQVGPAHIADEERVSSQHRHWLRRVFCQIENKDGDRLNRVPRSFHHLDAQPRKLQRLAVVHWHEFVLGLRSRAKVNRRPAPVAQLQMPGHKSRMKVSKKEVADFQPELLRIVQILPHVALRINYDSP